MSFKKVFDIWDAARLKADCVRLSVSQQKNMKNNYEIDRYSLKGDMSDYKKEIISFWSRYVSHPYTDYHGFYLAKTGKKDVRFIPEPYYFSAIEREFYHYRCDFVSDKNYFSTLFSDIKQPETIVRNNFGILTDADNRAVTIEQAADLCREYEEIIIKPSVGTACGQGIEFINPQKTDMISKLSSFRRDFIIQNVVKQHSSAARLNASSLNTIRAISMVFEGKAYVLSKFIRFGQPGARVDNVGAGGFFCGIDESGHLREKAYAPHFASDIDRLSDGTPFKEIVIPDTDKLDDLICRAHLRYPRFGIISWDFAVDEEGDFVLIEANFKKCGIIFHQVCNGPLFGDMTERVLESVYNKR